MRFLSLASKWLVLILVINLASAVTAQGVSVDDAPPASGGVAWTLTYAGLNVGAATSRVSWSEGDTGFRAVPPSTGHNGDNTGAAFGIQFGQWHQVSERLALGFEVAWTRLDHKTLESFVTNSSIPSGHYRETRIENALSVIGRAGIPSGNWLPYAEAGLSYAKVGFTNAVYGCVVACTMEATDTNAGYVLGFGVDYRASERVLLGLNYRYTRYSAESYDRIGTEPFPDENIDLDARSGVLSLRVSYVF